MDLINNEVKIHYGDEELIMGRIYVVATPIGNLSDISKRALETLKSSSLILAEDTRHSLKLLNHYNIRNKLMSYHKFNERERCEYIVNKIIDEDIDVSLISDAGTPCIQDPGYLIINHARKMNIEILAIPGPSAAISALSVCGINIDEFAFYGFLPRDKSSRCDKLEKIKNTNIDVFVLYESPKRIKFLLEDLIKFFKNSEVCVCSDISKIHEKYYFGNVCEVYEKIINNDKSELGEYVVIVHNLEYIETKECEDKISTEALIIDEMMKEDISFKEAIIRVSKKHSLGKNECYRASLKIKEIFHDI